MTTTVVGIDPSLTSTGLAVMINGKRMEATHFPTKGRKSATLDERRYRLLSIADDVATYLARFDPDLVVIENPAYSRTMGAAHDRSGLWWLLVERVAALDVRVAAIAPNTRAKYLTGNGRATKEAVLAEVNARWGENLGRVIHVDDEADALILAAIGSERMGFPAPNLPGPQKGDYVAPRGV